MARPNDPSSIYLDANPLIFAILGKTGCEPVVEVLRLAEIGKVRLYTSTFSYVEARGQGKTDPFDPAIEAEAMRVLDSIRITKVDFSRRMALRARHYTQQYGLGNIDAIHLASAVAAEVDVLMTWDKGFKGKYDRAIDGVWIAEPYVPGAPTLPGI